MLIVADSRSLAPFRHLAQYPTARTAIDGHPLGDDVRHLGGLRGRNHGQHPRQTRRSHWRKFATRLAKAQHRQACASSSWRKFATRALEVDPERQRLRPSRAARVPGLSLRLRVRAWRQKCACARFTNQWLRAMAYDQSRRRIRRDRQPSVPHRTRGPEGEVERELWGQERIHSGMCQTPRAVSVSEVRARLHDAARFRARSTSHTVAARDGCTNIPLAAGRGSGDETILSIGMSGHGYHRFVHPDPPELIRSWEI